MKIKTLMICEKPTQLKQIKETSEFNELYKTRDFKFHFAHTVVPFFIFKYVQTVYLQKYICSFGFAAVPKYTTSFVSNQNKFDVCC